LLCVRTKRAAQAAQPAQTAHRAVVLRFCTIEFCHERNTLSKQLADTDRNLLLRAARTERCAGEGKLVFGLTKLGGYNQNALRGVNGRFLAVFARLWVRVPASGGLERHCGPRLALNSPAHGRTFKESLQKCLRSPENPNGIQIHQPSGCPGSLRGYPGKPSPPAFALLRRGRPNVGAAHDPPSSATAQSARGLAHSKTLRAVRASS